MKDEKITEEWMRDIIRHSQAALFRVCTVPTPVWTGSGSTGHCAS